jgi:hypothetical protein
MTALTGVELRELVPAMARQLARGELRRARRDARVGTVVDTARLAALVALRCPDHALVDSIVKRHPQDARAVARWTLLTADAVTRVQSAIAPALEVPTAPSNVVGLGIDERIACLLPEWLRTLVDDAARYLGGLTVSVDASSAETGRRGVCDHGADPIAIALAPEVLGAELELVLAHELAHAIDAQWNERTIADREEFAERLADLAVAEHPRTVSQMLELGSPVSVRLAAPDKTSQDLELVACLTWIMAFADVDPITWRRS